VFDCLAKSTPHVCGAQSLALITAVFEVITGDIIGLRRVLLRKADHSFSAITEGGECRERRARHEVVAG
jgi:hypothetical protein